MVAFLHRVGQTSAEPPMRTGRLPRPHAIQVTGNPDHGPHPKASPPKVSHASPTAAARCVSAPRHNPTARDGRRRVRPPRSSNGGAAAAHTAAAPPDLLNRSIPALPVSR
ncbi:hypothetical protein GCM10029976_092320 [Kribbella albertanoniae]